MSAFRIPLAGPYTSRISSVNASDGTSGYVGVGIVGLMVVGKTSSATSKDARYINAFCHTVSDPVTGSKRVYAVKRPGFATSITPASGNVGNAIYVWTGKGTGTDVISSFGSTNSTVYNGTSSLGAITGVCTGITETFVSATPTLTVTSTDNTGWYYDTGVGVMTKITDVDFPGNAGLTLAGTFAHIDGFACVMTTDGKVWASDLNTVTGWTATSFGSANSYPDKGVALVRHRNYMMAFGSESIQFFYNAGLTPFPLANAANLTVKVGAVSATAITQISDTTFWCGSTPQGGLSVFQYDGGLSRISTPEIDSILVLAGASNVSLTSLRFYGMSFVLVQAGAQTLVYCVEERMWHQWNSTTTLWYKCAGVSNGGVMVNYAISKDSTSGKVYVMNQALLVFTDDGTTYSAIIQLPPQDFGTMRKKFWNEMEVVGDVETSTSPLTISYSDDDYQTYTVWGDVDLSAQRRRANRLGSARRRAWVFTHSANTPMRIEAMEGNAKVGTS